MKSNALIYAMNDVDPDIIRKAEPGRKKAVNSSNFMVALSVLMIALVLIPVGLFLNKDTVAARVYLDVNPSFSFDVSKDGKILSIIAENDDASKVLTGSDITSERSDLSVGKLLGAILASGYFTEEKDTVLLSIECENDAFAEELKSEYASDTDLFFSEKMPEGHAIIQRLYESVTSKTISDKYGVSKGTAAFMIRLIGIKEDYTEDKLASLDISSLRRLCVENGIGTDHNVMLMSAEADKIARSAMTEKLNDDPVGSTVYGYADNGERGFWRIIVQGNVTTAVYDVDCETGEISDEKHAPLLDRTRLLDFAITGAGYTSEDISHYDYLKSDAWIPFYVTLYVSGSETEKYLSGDIDLDLFTVCDVKLHTLNGEFLSVNVNNSTGELLSAKKSNYTYSIDTLDAVLILMDDAGVIYDVPPFPDSCVMADGLCSIELECEEVTYKYQIDAFTGEILSKSIS